MKAYKAKDLAKDLAKLTSDDLADELSSAWTQYDAFESGDVRTVCQVGEEVKAYHCHALGSTYYEQLKEVQEHVDRGSTVVLNSTHKYVKNALPLAYLASKDDMTFVSSKGGVSFPMHADRVRVIFYCLRGSKLFNFEEQEPIQVTAGEVLIIPPGCRHQVENLEASVCISFGVKDG